MEPTPGIVSGKGIRMVSGLPSQSLKILWDIKGWKRLLKLPHELLKLRLPFEIGADVGIKSKWEFSFRQQRLEKIQLWLHMLKFEGDEVNVTVSRQLAILTKELGVQDTWRDYALDFCYSESTLGLVDLTNIVFPMTPTGNSMIYPQQPDDVDIMLDGGTLSLRFKFTVFLNNLENNLEVPYSEPPPLLALDVCRQNQRNSMLTMLREGIGADVTILTKDDKEVKAHQCILSAHSSVFRAMFSTEMAEKKVGIVEMTDIGSEGLNIFLEFCYTGEIAESWGDFFEDVINAADKYDLPLLMDLCDELLYTLCTKANCLDLIKVTNLHKMTKEY
ncbi:uncharacterized protein LOC110850517 [Folsomia candida]|uniref:uncharacterized protein LOC110850517 n=1 Tax=Folsomia candida TaxID=158441 RepID=UPI001604CF02|nr:uncharacterized protein LOC110850517 [Folsomia candida]